MAVTRVTPGGTASQVATGAAPTIAKSALSGLQDGDLLVATISQNGGADPTGPTDWFKEGSFVGGTNPRQSVWTHYVSSVAAEPASWVWSGPSVAYSIQITAYRGHNVTGNGATAFDAFSITGSGTTSVSAITPDITTTVADTVLVGGSAGNSSSTTWTPGAGNTLTEVYDAGASKSHSFYSDESRVSAGATGTRTFTQSQSRAWTAWLGAIAPATGGGTPVSVDVPLGGFTVSGQLPSPTAQPMAPLGSVGVSGQIPNANAQASAPIGSLGFSGTAPLGSGTLVAPLGSYATSGLNPGGYAQASAPLGVWTVAGYIPIGGVGVPLGSLAVSALPPNGAGKASAPLGALMLTGLVPSPKAQAGAPLGQWALTGLVPTLAGRLAVPLGAYALSPLTTAAESDVSTPLGSVTLTGQNPSGRGAATAPIGTLTLFGLIPAIDSGPPPGAVIVVPLGAIAITGLTPNAKAAATAPLGNLGLSGNLPGSGSIIPLGSLSVSPLALQAMALPAVPIGNLSLNGLIPDAAVSALVELGVLAFEGLEPRIVSGGLFGVFAGGEMIIVPSFQSGRPMVTTSFLGIFGRVDSFSSGLVRVEKRV